MAEALAAVRPLDHAALYDLGRGKYGAAYDKCPKSLDIRASLLPADLPLTLQSAQILGETLLHTGDLNSARDTLQKAISGREKMRGECHPDRLESFRGLTITLLQLDDIAAEEEISMRA